MKDQFNWKPISHFHIKMVNIESKLHLDDCQQAKANQ